MFVSVTMVTRLKFNFNFFNPFLLISIFFIPVSGKSNEISIGYKKHCMTLKANLSKVIVLGVNCDKDEHGRWYLRRGWVG